MPEQLVTVYHRETGETREMTAMLATEFVRASGGQWSHEAPLPRGWDWQTPRYRATCDLRPAPMSRVRTDSPHSSDDAYVWQYGERSISNGETVITEHWPHPSFHPLNVAAKQIMKFFTTSPRSRMAVKPVRGGRVILDDGMSSPLPDLAGMKHKAGQSANRGV